MLVANELDRLTRPPPILIPTVTISDDESTPHKDTSVLHELERYAQNTSASTESNTQEMTMRIKALLATLEHTKSATSQCEGIQSLHKVFSDSPSRHSIDEKVANMLEDGEIDDIDGMPIGERLLFIIYAQQYADDAIPSTSNVVNILSDEKRPRGKTFILSAFDNTNDTVDKTSLSNTRRRSTRSREREPPARRDGKK
jgi:hypothetical protein